LLSVVIGLPIMLFYLPGAFNQSVTPIAVLFCIFGLACAITALNANRTMIAAIELCPSNGELASKYALAAQRADRASQDKSNFLAAAAHDMRQQVQSLILLQGLLRNAEGNQKNHAVLDQMQSAATSIGNLFESVMELSRLESGVAIAQFESIPIESFVADRIAQHLPMAANKGLRIRLSKSRSSLGCLVSAEYTAQGRIVVTLRKHTPRKIYIEVWDTGIGIAPPDLERVFEPYVQVGNDTRSREKGLGLGTSKLGKGTRIRVLLNKTAVPKLISKLHPNDSPRITKAAFKELRVLLLDGLASLNELSIRYPSMHKFVGTVRWLNR
jgi:signal transduction histidine kinase